jgi:hypothetical protein
MASRLTQVNRPVSLGEQRIPMWRSNLTFVGPRSMGT